jgi:signal peptidase II
MRWHGPLSRFGFVVAVAVILVDQASKYLVIRLFESAPGKIVTVTPFLDLVLALNRGISYGLFPQDGDAGRWLLTAVKLGAAVLFAIWLGRAQSRLVALSLGLLIGGALGNAFDRVVYGAVVDFVSLHAFGWYWYVFNFADCAIVAGVIGLLYDAAFGSATKSPPSG